MLVIEGPDNSGKSTLAKYISDQTGIPINHFKGPPTGIDDFKKRIYFMMANHNEFIFDRIPLISEGVYSILREGCLLHGLENKQKVKIEFLKLNPLIIYCRPSIRAMTSTPHLPKAYDTAEHLKALMDKQITLIEQYDKIMSNPLLKHWTYDYEVQSKESLTGVVIEELKQRNHYKGVL